MQFTVPEQLVKNPQFLRLMADFLENTEKLQKPLSDNVNEKTPHAEVKEKPKGLLETIGNILNTTEKVLEASDDKAKIELLEFELNEKKKVNVYRKYIENLQTTDVFLLSDYENFKNWYCGEFKGKAVPSIFEFRHNMMKNNAYYVQPRVMDTQSVLSEYIKEYPNKLHDSEVEYNEFKKWFYNKYATNDSIPGFSIFISEIADLRYTPNEKKKEDVYQMYIDSQHDSRDLILMSDYEKFKCWHCENFKSSVPDLVTFEYKMRKRGRFYMARGVSTPDNVIVNYVKEHPNRLSSIELEYNRFKTWFYSDYKGIDAAPSFKIFTVDMRTYY